MFGKGVSPAQLHLLFSFSLLRAPCLACSRPASALYWGYHRRHRSRESSPAHETNSRSNRAMSELGQSRRFDDVRVTSAFPPIATKEWTSRDVSNPGDIARLPGTRNLESNE